MVWKKTRLPVWGWRPRTQFFWVCVLPFVDLNSSQIGKVDITTLFYWNTGAFWVVHCGLWHICRTGRDMSCIAILGPQLWPFTAIQWLAHNSHPELWCICWQILAIYGTHWHILRSDNFTFFADVTTLAAQITCPIWLAFLSLCHQWVHNKTIYGRKIGCNIAMWV